MPCGCLCPNETESGTSQSTQLQSTPNTHSSPTSPPKTQVIPVSAHPPLSQPLTVATGVNTGPLSPLSATVTLPGNALTPNSEASTIHQKTQMDTPLGSARQGAAGQMGAASAAMSTAPATTITPVTPPDSAFELDPTRANVQSPKPPNATLAAMLVYSRYSTTTVVPSATGPDPLLLSHQANALLGPAAPEISSKPATSGNIFRY